MHESGHSICDFGPKEEMRIVRSTIRVRSTCLPNKWPTILASDYRGMKISSMKEGFIHKLNSMVILLKSVDRDTEKCIKVPCYRALLQREEMRAKINLTPKMKLSYEMR